MKPLDRAHEWLADRLPFIQYPKIGPADARTRSHHGIRFKHRMSLIDRLALLVSGVVFVLLGLAGLSFACFVGYIIIQAL